MTQYSLPRGELDQRIELLRVATVDDGYAHQPGEETSLATVWAKVRPVAGSERTSAAQTSATAPIVFTIDWRTSLADLSPKDRLRFGGRVYDIRTVTPLGRRVAIEILAVASADA